MTTARNAHTLALVGADRLETLQARHDRTGLLFLAGHVLLTMLTGGLLWLALEGGLLWLLLAMMMLHGIVLVHWFAPLHEGAHDSAFRSAWLNTLVVWMAGLIIMIVPSYFKYEHVAHHAYTADPDKDPERIPQAETFRGYLYYASAIPYFIGVLDVLWRLPWGRFSAQEKRFIATRRHAQVQREAALMVLVYILLALVSVWMQSWVVVIFWLLPRMIAEPFMRLIRMSEHVGCEPVPDMLRNTRSVITSTPLRLLAWNMCYHAEHHSLPRVPFYALPDLHMIIRDHLQHLCQGYPQAQLELIRNGLNNRQV